MMKLEKLVYCSLMNFKGSTIFKNDIIGAGGSLSH